MYNHNFVTCLWVACIERGATLQVEATIQRGQGTHRIVLSVQPNSKPVEEISVVW